MKYDIQIKGKLSEIKDILPIKANVKLTQFNEEVSMQFNEEDKDAILENLYKNNAEVINEDNIHRYYKFMSNKDKMDIKNKYIISDALCTRYYAICKILFKDEKPENIGKYILDVMNRDLQKEQFIFGVKDTLAPLEEYVSEIKNSIAYKEYEANFKIDNIDISTKTNYMQMKIKKSTAIQYEVRNDDGTNPIFITIKEDGKKACHFSATGDFGNYAHYWGCMGTDYKTFLSSLDYDYFFKTTMKKIKAGYTLDVNATIDSIKRELFINYREQLFDRLSREEKRELKKEARFFYNELNELKNISSNQFDEEFYNNIYHNTSNEIKYFNNLVYDGIPEVKYKRDGQCKGFWEMFQGLCDLWRREK